MYELTANRMDLNYATVTEHIIGASDAPDNNDASETEEASDR